jgi:hypothetical protein
VIAAAVGGDTTGRTQIGKARTAVEKCRSHLEWAIIQRQAAEVAYRRTNDDECAARRGVIAERCKAEISSGRPKRQAFLEKRPSNVA